MQKWYENLDEWVEDCCESLMAEGIKGKDIIIDTYYKDEVGVWHRIIVHNIVKYKMLVEEFPKNLPERRPGW